MVERLNSSTSKSQLAAKQKGHGFFLSYFLSFFFWRSNLVERHPTLSTMVGKIKRERKERRERERVAGERREIRERVRERERKSAHDL